MISMVNSILRKKTILILSPQAWGNMFLSKHHYAVELARQGNRVFFLNPPLSGSVLTRSKIDIHSSTEYPGLFIIDHSLGFPYNLKFHARRLFHFFMKRHVKKIVKTLGTPDIIWSFDLGNLYPFSFFPTTALKIFHPVDEPLNFAAIESAKGADIIFSVTHEILLKFSSYGIPSYFINHGVSEVFLSIQPQHGPDDRVKVGFSGNLLRKDIDRDIFMKIVQDNPNVQFHCWGPYKMNNSNLGGDHDLDTKRFIDQLEASKNVILHGPVSPETLASAFLDMSVFLICYDIRKDQSNGTNYHKIMEYIASGKIIVSNNVTTYKDRPDLLLMAQSRENNRELPALFRKVISDLSVYNSASNIARRKEYARLNTYSSQVQRISEVLSKHFQQLNEEKARNSN